MGDKRTDDGVQAGRHGGAGCLGQGGACRDGPPTSPRRPRPPRPHGVRLLSGPGVAAEAGGKGASNPTRATLFICSFDGNVSRESARGPVRAPRRPWDRDPSARQRRKDGAPRPVLVLCAFRRFRRRLPARVLLPGTLHGAQVPAASPARRSGPRPSPPTGAAAAPPGALAAGPFRRRGDAHDAPESEGRSRGRGFGVGEDRPAVRDKAQPPAPGATQTGTGAGAAEPGAPPGTERAPQPGMGGAGRPRAGAGRSQGTSSDPRPDPDRTQSREVTGRAGPRRDTPQ